MTLTINNRPLLHAKKQERKNFLATSFVAGNFLCGDKSGLMPTLHYMFHVAGASSIWQVSPASDAPMQLPNSGIAGSFGAGSCGEFRAIGAPGGAITNTAAGGSVNTIQTNKIMTRDCRGSMVRVVAGSGVGYEGTITSNTIGTNGVLTVSPASAVAFDATTQFQMWTGSLWFMNAGTTAVGFSVYDFATNAWTARSVTNLPTAWGTTGQLVSTGSAEGVIDRGTCTGSATSTTLPDLGKKWVVNAQAGLTVRIARGTGAGQYRTITSNTETALTVPAWAVTPDATSYYVIEVNEVGTSTGTNTTTTLNDTTKTWTANQWANYAQVRIAAGTGAGQVRAIASNTTNALTIGTAWTVTPDATSVYVVEPCDDFLYLFGNNAVTAYKFTISTNAWAVLTPGTARGGSMAAGGTADWICGITDSQWIGKGDPANYRQNGRYVFSWRGGGSSLMDRFDLAAVTWINGASAGVAGSYGGQNETFTTGSCSVDADGYIYLNKESSGRFFRFDVVRFEMVPWYESVEVNSTTVEGDRLCVAKYIDGGRSVKWVYFGMHSRQDLFRVMEIN